MHRVPPILRVLPPLEAPQRRQIHAPQEPPGGWRGGFERLVLEGKCPWCAGPILGISVSQEHGVTWSCAAACNP
jgi:hypothetical protein